MYDCTCTWRISQFIKSKFQIRERIPRRQFVTLSRTSSTEKSFDFFISLKRALGDTMDHKKYGEIWIKRICVTTETTQFHKLSAGNDNRSRAVYKQWTTEAARTKGPPEYIYINILSPRPANTIDKRGIWIMKEDAIYLFVYLCMYARVI